MTEITDCEDHEDCVAIESEGWPDVAGSWRSHFSAEVDPAARLNPDDPKQAKAKDRRTGAMVSRRSPSVQEAERLLE